MPEEKQMAPENNPFYKIEFDDPVWRKESWKTRRLKDALIFRANAWCRKDKNTAETPVVMQEAKMWRLPANANTRNA